jgi:hypothetical protein
LSIVLTLLIAAGIVGASTAPPSNVTTPTARIIPLTQAGSMVVAAQTLDPTDVLDYVLNLDSITEPSEDFASINLAVVAGSAALGFTILNDAAYAPEELSDSRVRIWVSIEEADRGLSAWAGQGTVCSIEVTATTDSIPPRVFQRTAGIRVAQK